MACMQSPANIKLQKLCSDVDGSETNCQNCYCRPMWCVDCMARWFAAKQEEDDKDNWLSSKCTCPMCRARFCMLDVCFLKDGISPQTVEEHGEQNYGFCSWMFFGDAFLGIFIPFEI